MSDRIGIIDWGIGGISIYKLLKVRSSVPVSYFSDTGVTPYGKMSRRELASRLDAVIEFLKARGVTYVVIGCNAASTALGDLTDHGLPILGVIEPAIEASIRLGPSHLGVVGGRRTILSGAYRSAFRSVGINTSQRIAQPLSGMIESGDVSSTSLNEAAKTILSPLRGCSHILLACTHYPAIKHLLASHVSQTTQFIDPAEALVATVLKEKLRGQDSDEFFTTGDVPAMKRAARLAFGVTIKVIRQARI